MRLRFRLCMEQSQAFLHSTFYPKVEYIAICEAGTNVKWRRTLLAEITFKLKSASVLWCDIKIAKTWLESGDSMRRAKHIDIKYHFVNESTQNGVILFQDIDSDKIPADGFKKPFMKHRFE